MKTYARINSGVVVEIINPLVLDGIEIPVEDRFTAEYVSTMVRSDTANPLPEGGWTYANGAFKPPVPVAPTAGEILAGNTSARDYRLSVAALAIAPLQDATDLGDAKPAETELLKKWKQYRVAVSRIDLTATNPAWPKEPA